MVIFRLLASAVVLVHLGFVLFVVLGGLLVARWRALAPFHLLSAGYGAAIEIGQWVCPLTPLENALRRRGGETGYPGGFVEHYLVSILYPGPLPHPLPYLLAGLVVLCNLGVYGWLLAHRRPGR